MSSVGARSRIEEAGRGLQAILFWGAVAAVLGLLGTVAGIIMMTQMIQLAGTAEPRLLWAGVGVTLITLVFGLLVFLLEPPSPHVPLLVAHAHELHQRRRLRPRKGP